jgi:hypothetical protein
MSDLRLDGQEHYRQAVLEAGPLAFDEQLAAAEEAVFLRMEELRSSADGQIQRQAIEDAIRFLSVLKGEILKSTIGTETNLDTSNYR